MKFAFRARSRHFSTTRHENSMRKTLLALALFATLPCTQAAGQFDGI
jgi:hypothetical protein